MSKIDFLVGVLFSGTLLPVGISGLLAGIL
jgi:hypothetical protein